MGWGRQPPPRRGEHPAPTQPLTRVPVTPEGGGGARGGGGLLAPGSEAMAPDKHPAGAEERENDLFAADHVSVGSGTPAADLLTA